MLSETCRRPNGQHAHMLSHILQSMHICKMTTHRLRRAHLRRLCCHCPSRARVYAVALDVIAYVPCPYFHNQARYFSGSFVINQASPCSTTAAARENMSQAKTRSASRILPSVRVISRFRGEYCSKRKNTCGDPLCFDMEL